MSNTAAILKQTSQPLEVGEVALPSPAKDQVLIETRAVAINPYDAARQDFGPAVFPWVKLPAVLGGDVAGVITAVGSDVTKVKVGDRVAAFVLEGFQKYAVAEEKYCIRLPDKVGFEDASVMPLCLGTATQSLFQSNQLALPLPNVASVGDSKGQAILIGGGTTSVGSNLIQLAAAAGYEVITTASPSNFDYVKKLGASTVFDYNSPTITQDLIEACREKSLVGAVANTRADAQAFTTVAESFAQVLLGSPNHKPFLSLMMPSPVKLPEGVQSKYVDFTERDADVCRVICQDYLPEALASGAFVPAPPPLLAGEGLESMQKGMDLLKKGVSARKVVVKI